ncbi:MAG: polysaccharide pyruvyl transferase family protein [Elainellaceae cyanobacterium]
MTAPRYDRFRRRRDYLRRQPVLGYIGYIGYGNFGDELLFAAIARLFSQQLIAYDGAAQPVHRDPKYYLPKRMRVYRRVLKPALYDGILLGGGTLINREAFLSRLQQAMSRYPCAVFGTGVCEPEFWQQHHSAVDHISLMEDWATALKSVAYLSVRGPKSAQILQSFGLAPKVIGDPALSIDALRHAYRRTRRVAVNVGSHGIQWGNQEAINQTVQRLCFSLHRQGWWVEFLALNDTDWAIATQISEALSEAFGRPFPCRMASDIPSTLAYLKTCDVLIGQRLHATVAAHACGVPAVLLSYAPKCEDYMASMALEDFTVRTDRLAPTAEAVAPILAQVAQINDSYKPCCQQIREKVERYQYLQMEAAQAVSQLF